MKKTIGSIIVATILIGISLVFLKGSTSADEDNGITVTPVQYELTMTPGEQKEITGKIRNNTDEKITVAIEFASLNVEALIKEDRLQLEDSDDPKSPGTWLSINTSKVLVQPGKERKVSVGIQIPEDAELKGFYPAIIYQPEIIKGSGGKVEISEKIVSLVLLNVTEVKGEYAISSGRINMFSSLKSLVFTPQVTFSANFENTGQTYIHPRGRIHIYDRGGMHLSDTPTVNDEYRILMQGQDLGEELIWNIKDTGGILPPFGKYRAVLEIYHNPDQKEVSRAETTFYVVPLWSILILLGIVLFVIGMFFIGRYLKRNYL